MLLLTLCCAEQTSFGGVKKVLSQKGSYNGNFGFSERKTYKIVFLTYYTIIYGMHYKDLKQNLILFICLQKQILLLDFICIFMLKIKKLS